MAVYLIDKRFADMALDLAKKDKNAKVVLIQDGVFVDAAAANKRELYYLKTDLEKRGIENIPEKANMITYDELIELVEKDGIYNFI